MGAPSSASTTRNGLIESSRSRSEEHTSELQSPCNLVCRLLLEKKKYNTPISSNASPKHRLTMPPLAAPCYPIMSPLPPFRPQPTPLFRLSFSPTELPCTLSVLR